MKAYQVTPGEGLAGLKAVERAARAPAAGEVVVGVRAVSLNYRDTIIPKFNYAGEAKPLVPCSDGAGEVLAVGSAVKRFKKGDRVAGIFFQGWLDGPIGPAETTAALGGGVDGMLAQQVHLDENGLVAVPHSYTYAEAACLPCAAVTAWNALFVEGGIRPGDTVLLQGTGGVSIWALQLAKAAGMRVILTSSSDDKLKRVRDLGADDTINYKATPEWQNEALKLTGGRGVDLVLEVGGADTLKRSVMATRYGGTVAVIGGVSGFAGPFELMPLLMGAKTMKGIYVGSRKMFEDLNRFVTAQKIKPVVDRAFPFEQARAAYDRLEAARHFGKVVIEVPA
ncbi:MAG: NAD(P)-dependent alcohol dehydrogenase [Nevskia sp.]|nr:NAD(P)-dependent alcohol dehydrogenase [Nevskia sp.]